MPISEETLKQHIGAVLKTEDLCGLSLRGVREKLAAPPFNVSEDDINSNKSTIKMLVTTLLPEAKEAQQKALQLQDARDPEPEPRASARGGKGTKRPAPENEEPLTLAKRPAKGKGSGKGKGAVTNFSRQRFLDNAPNEVQCNMQEFAAPVPVIKREFSTGSCGWYGNAKVVAMIDGEPVRVQCQFSLICVGSKEWTE